MSPRGQTPQWPPTWRYPESGPEEKDGPAKDVEKNATWERRHRKNSFGEISRKRRVDRPNIEEEKDVAETRRAGDTRNIRHGEDADTGTMPGLPEWQYKRRTLGGLQKNSRTMSDHNETDTKELISCIPT